MDTSMTMTRLEAAVEHQLLAAGAEPEVEAAAQALLAVLEPALRQVAYDLAEQAAIEVASQLEGHEVDVVLAEGDPALRIRHTGVEDPAVTSEQLDARITLRLPPTLKEMVEAAADSRGESVNTWLVKTLQSGAAGKAKRVGRRVTGTIET